MNTDAEKIIVYLFCQINHYLIVQMNDFTIRIDRLTERLRRDMAQCDRIEERALLAEENLTSLDQSVQSLARLIEVSLLFVLASDKEKYSWTQCINTNNYQMNNSIVQQFFYRLEQFLQRSLVDIGEKQAYIQALSLVQKPSIVSSRLLFK